MRLLHTKWRTCLTVGAGLGMAGLLLTAAPAAAATGNSAYGAQTTGLVAAGPFAASSFPGPPTTATVLNVTVPGVLGAGVVSSTSSATGATANVANANAPLGGLNVLAADSVTATCTFNPNNGKVHGTTSILNGRIASLGITLLPNPGPNTLVAGVGGLATITLNRQVTHLDGSLTVDGIVITLVGSTETIVLSSATCQKATVVGTPLMSRDFAIGAGSLVLFGGGFYLVRRRLVAVRRQG